MHRRQQKRRRTAVIPHQEGEMALAAQRTLQMAGKVLLPTPREGECELSKERAPPGGGRVPILAKRDCSPT